MGTAGARHEHCMGTAWALHEHGMRSEFTARVHCMCTLHVYTAGVLCATYDENSIVPQGGRSESCGAGTGGREGAARSPPLSPPGAQPQPPEGSRWHRTPTAGCRRRPLDLPSHVLGRGSPSPTHALAFDALLDASLIRHGVFVKEATRALCRALSERAQRRLYKVVVVIDFKGVGTQHTSSDFLRLFRSYANQFNLNYPEFMSRCFVINAPYFVVGLWAVVKHWLDPRTAAKVGLPPQTHPPHPPQPP